MKHKIGFLIFVAIGLAHLAHCCVQFDQGKHGQQKAGKRREARDITSNCGPNDTIPPNRVNTTEMLTLVRGEMAKVNVDIFIVPLDEVGRMLWLSGFSGSNAQAVITQQEARLWTDGRYFIQAANQLDCNWYLMRIGEDEVPTLPEWISRLEEGKNISADPNLIGAETWVDWEETFHDAGLELTTMDKNIIDNVWTEENGRPDQVHRDIVVHNVSYAGVAWQDKLEQLRDKLLEEKMFAMVVTEHDEIAWLFNLRGEGNSSLEGLFHSPLFESMALVSETEVHLWVHSEKVTPAVEEHLAGPQCQTAATCVNITQFHDRLTDLDDWIHQQEKLEKILLSKPSKYLSGATYSVYKVIPKDYRKLDDSPILTMKAVKNDVEDLGMMAAHERDAVALCDWAAMLEDQVEVRGSRQWTEISAAKQLDEYRARQQGSRGPSFGTISAFGPNGAIIHYSATPETNTRITNESLYMVDSGGQYLDGTTDVTRTFHYGRPTAEMISSYTLVLMGAIDLAMVVVPDKSLDTAIDLATRQPLFRKGLNFRHGTGHGIGAYLKVHEGPIRIAMAGAPGSFRPGMFFSDEPGYYKEGEFGLRLETILKATKKSFDTEEYGDFLEFVPVTLVPFEPKLIDFEMMKPEQIQWYNDYNKLVMEKIAPRFLATSNDRAYQWLVARTQQVDPTRSKHFQKWIGTRGA